MIKKLNLIYLVSFIFVLQFGIVELCGGSGGGGGAGGEWRGGACGSGVARSPSHESVTTELSLLSISSAASDARVLRLLACRAGQGPDPNLRVASPNPDSRLRRAGSTLPLAASLSRCSGDGWREVLAGCAAICAQLGLRRSFSAGDLERVDVQYAPRRLATSEVGLCAALEALTLSAASRSCSTWVAVGGSQLPSPQRTQPAPPRLPPGAGDNRKVRQSYIKRRLLTTYKALERMSQSEYHLDKLEAAAAAAGPGPTTLAVPPPPPAPAPAPHYRLVHPEAAALALTAAEVERERGRPLTKYERNMMIFNWLHTLPDAEPPLPPP